MLKLHLRVVDRRWVLHGLPGAELWILLQLVEGPELGKSKFDFSVFGLWFERCNFLDAREERDHAPARHCFVVTFDDLDCQEWPQKPFSLELNALEEHVATADALITYVQVADALCFITVDSVPGLLAEFIFINLVDTPSRQVVCKTDPQSLVPRLVQHLAKPNDRHAHVETGSLLLRHDVHELLSNLLCLFLC